jgi:hypothetical protein
LVGRNPFSVPIALTQCTCCPSEPGGSGASKPGQRDRIVLRNALTPLVAKGQEVLGDGVAPLGSSLQ